MVSFDLTTGEPVSTFLAATDTLNGFQFHPYLPLAATASGARSCTHCLSLPIACPQMLPGFWACLVSVSKLLPDLMTST